ncbi:MAG: hypothetical protein FWC55_07005 [Firmicutes bacterium]|nr:hypothetical protein [Bacillota bacterium]
MTEMVINARTLPEPLFRLIRAEKVAVRVVDGEVRLTPVKEVSDNCPLLGMYTDGKLTVDRFLEWKREDRELEL